MYLVWCLTGQICPIVMFVPWTFIYFPSPALHKCDAWTEGVRSVSTQAMSHWIFQMGCPQVFAVFSCVFFPPPLTCIYVDPMFEHVQLYRCDWARRIRTCDSENGLEHFRRLFNLGGGGSSGNFPVGDRLDGLARRFMREYTEPLLIRSIKKEWRDSLGLGMDNPNGSIVAAHILGRKCKNFKTPKARMRVWVHSEADILGPIHRTSRSTVCAHDHYPIQSLWNVLKKCAYYVALKCA